MHPHHAQANVAPLTQASATPGPDRRAERSNDWTDYWHINVGEGSSPHRRWDDCRHYGFLLAGGGPEWIHQIQRPEVGDSVLAYVNEHGYVGVGRVVSEAVPQQEFITPTGLWLIDQPMLAPPDLAILDDPENCDWCLGIHWLHTVDRDEAIMKHHAYRGTAVQIKQPHVVEDVLGQWRLWRTAD